MYWALVGRVVHMWLQRSSVSGTVHLGRLMLMNVLVGEFFLDSYRVQVLLLPKQWAKG